MNRPYDYTAYDVVVVERLVLADHPGDLLRPADAAEATRRLAALGYSDGQIAYRLGYSRRAVARIRRRRHIAAALTPAHNQWNRLREAPNLPRMAS